MAQTYAEQDRSTTRARAARVGAVVTPLAMALSVYGAYGDPTAPDSQKSAVPSVLVMIVVVAVVTFGLLAPMALRAVQARTAAGRRWAAGLTTVAVVGLVIFWSGLPLIAGGAAALVGRAGKEGAQSSRAFPAAWVLGLFAAGASIVVTIVGNLAH